MLENIDPPPFRYDGQEHKTESAGKQVQEFQQDGKNACEDGLNSGIPGVWQKYCAKGFLDGEERDLKIQQIPL